MDGPNITFNKASSNISPAKSYRVDSKDLYIRGDSNRWFNYQYDCNMTVTYHYCSTWIILGATIDFARGRVSPIGLKIADVWFCALMIRQAASVQARVWLCLLGLMASVPSCHLRTREIQLYFLGQFQVWRHPQSLRIPVPRHLYSCLSWWIRIRWPLCFTSTGRWHQESQQPAFAGKQCLSFCGVNGGWF